MSVIVWGRNKALPLLQAGWPVASLTLLAFGLRIYRLPDQPLWLDEIYTIELVREGPLAILRNSLSDPHPPLFYLLQWLASGFGAAQSELGFRWLAMLCGGLSVPLFYILCRKFTGSLSSALAALALAVSPFHIYYSQEGRSFTFLTMLVIITTLIVVKILEDPTPLRRWTSLALISLVGLYSSYTYLMILGVQGLFLLVCVRHRWRWLYAAMVTIGVGFAASLIVPTIIATARQHLNTTSLTLLNTIQSLAGEPARFSLAWQHGWLVYLCGGTALLGLVVAISTAKRIPLGLYLCGQLLLPLLILTVLQFYPGIRLPLYESRQFLILVPPLFGLVALGLDSMARRPGWFLPALFGVGMLVASGAGIQAYWGSVKSPEGSLIKSIRTELEAGETAVSLHYSLTAAIYAYVPQADVWTYRGNEAGEYHFDRELRLPLIAQLNPRSASEATIDEIRATPRFWVLSYTESNPELLTAMTDRCTPVRGISLFPFTATLWEQCTP